MPKFKVSRQYSTAGGGVAQLTVEADTLEAARKIAVSASVDEWDLNDYKNGRSFDCWLDEEATVGDGSPIEIEVEELLT